MYKLFIKEIKLSSHPLSFLFIVFSFIFLIPGYPILCAPFFVTLGIFQSFQKARENRDILFSVLLPITKKEIVEGKFIFTLFIELCSALLMVLCVILRNTILRDNPVYLSSVMMRADFFALFSALLIFALFNVLFVRGFFTTAYNLGLPFLIYSISTFITVAGGEVLSHLSFMKDSGNILDKSQLVFLSLGFLIYSLITFLSCKMSIKSFERLDL